MAKDLRKSLNSIKEKYQKLLKRISEGLNND